MELLVRQNKGRTQYPYYATELSHVLKMGVRPIEILDLEQTDRLFSVHRAQSMQRSTEPDLAARKVWNYEPVTVWLSTCKCVEERLRGEQAVLFAGPFEFCGAVKLSVDQALTAALSLLEFDQNSIRLQAVSSESGLFLDVFEEASEWRTELVVWGQWKRLSESCL
jgi:hypothetical protein